MGQSSTKYHSLPSAGLAMDPLSRESSEEEELYNADIETDDEFKTSLLPETSVENIMLEGAKRKEEKWWTLTLQIFFPFLVAGFGMVAAGLVLDVVQHWTVFVEISEIFILVPALLGLKGNLEMTLASRLSTAANMNKMDKQKDAIALIVGNLALVQCQGIVVGFLSAITGVLMGWTTTGSVRSQHILLLCASSVVTASIASFVLGLVMVVVIVVSTRCKINPDNVATPIAASLGDLTTLTLLAWISSILWEDLDSDQWLAPLIIAVYILFIPLCGWMAYRCSETRPVLFTGWIPVLVAMLISSGGGLILDFAVVRFHGIAVFQPVMNGVGGNLVAVQASRMSTTLHLQAHGQGPGQLKEGDAVCVTPCSIICGSNEHSRTACILLLLVLPGHFLFVYTITYLEAGHTTPSSIFMFFYLLAAWCQVAVLLYVCRIMVYLMWKWNIDPDNSAIPYLTALGDLLGGAFLGLAFQALEWAGDTQFSGSVENTNGANLTSQNTLMSADLRETGT